MELTIEPRIGCTYHIFHILLSMYFRFTPIIRIFLRGSGILGAVPTQ